MEVHVDGSVSLAEGIGDKLRKIVEDAGENATEYELLRTTLDSNDEEVLAGMVLLGVEMMHREIWGSGQY